MTTMNTNEARLEIQRFISTVLTAVAFDADDQTDDETLAELEASMDEISNILVEALGIEILAVENAEDRIFTARLSLLPSSVNPEPLDE